MKHFFRGSFNFRRFKEMLFRRLLSFIIWIFGTILFSQTSNLDAETRAFLYHVVKKSKVLEANLGNAFEYDGPVIKFSNGELNYDSIEMLIMEEPEKLIIRHHLIENAPKGLIAEISNKTAIWSLNKGLNNIRNQYRGNHMNIVEYYLATFHEFVGKKVQKHKAYAALFEVDVSPLFNPGLSLFDRDLLLFTSGFQDIQLRKQILEAQNSAIIKTIEHKAKILYEKLGGAYSVFDNLLLAAGDGSYTSGLLNENEKDEDGNWNKGLPKAVGLFPYQLEIVDGNISPLRISTATLPYVSNVKFTNLHFDVWGYNSDKQTTVIIEKDGKSYRLYGSSQTNFLSPDSTFSDGITIQKIINDIADKKFVQQENRIRDLNRGQTALEVALEEANIKIAMLDVHPGKYKKRKNKRVSEKQSELLMRKLEIQEEIIEIQEEKTEINETYLERRNLIDYYSNNLGKNLVGFIENHGVYFYEDSSFFNLETQEFFFPTSKINTPITIRLIAIPDDKFGEYADEVMLHVSRVDYNPFQFPDISFSVKDIFQSDKDELAKSFKIKKEDSLKLIKLFQNLKDIKPIELNLSGNGIAVWKNGKVIRDSTQSELLNYPGATTEERTEAKNSFSFASLRKINVQVKYDYQLHLSIESFTDPVRSNFKPKTTWQKECVSNSIFSKNDLLSAYRTLFTLQEFGKKLTNLAKLSMNDDLFKAFEKQWKYDLNRARIKIGEKLYPLSSFHL